jgi:hypothetical protein
MGIKELLKKAISHFMLFLCGAGSSRCPAPFLLEEIIYKVDKAFFYIWFIIFANKSYKTDSYYE